MPILDVVPEVRRALAEETAVVVAAPTGSGKTTALAPALIDEPWLEGRRILLLEPRRLAARAAARRMAASFDGKLGGVVGLTTSEERKVGPATRIEVVTEGILTRRLQRDPELADVGLVIFDEFHERSLQADLGLALTLDAREGLRLDLRIAVLSATLDTERVAALVDGPIVTSEGRMFPVGVRHLPRPDVRQLDRAVADAVATALALPPAEEGAALGDILVFLPGEAEIRRAERLLRSQARPDVHINPLYGALSAKEQDAALDSAPRGRKVVLATNIAETSLTIPGVTVVVDAGLVRRVRWDPASELERLETARISQASADQRAGRAGRVAPGTCLRMWDAGDRLEPFDPPELELADLAGLVLETLVWGANSTDDIRWLDAPPEVSVIRAHQLLVRLGALDDRGRLTDHGRRLSDFGAHPRLANLLARRHEVEASARDAALVAALLAEGDPLSAPPHKRASDIDERLGVLLGDHPPAGTSLRRATVDRIRRQSKRWEERLDRSSGQRGDRGRRRQREGRRIDSGPLVALAHPDRVARRRPGRPGHYLLVGGRGAVIPDSDPLAAEEFLAIAELDARDADARVRLAAPLDEADVEQLFAHQIVVEERVVWDDRRTDVLAVRERMLGSVALATEPIHKPDPALAAEALLDGIRREGIGLLKWTDNQAALRSRLDLAHQVVGDPWGDVSDEALLADLDDWLGPLLVSLPARKKADLSRLDLTTALWTRVGWHLKMELERLMPTHVTVPTGANIRLRYENDEVILAVRVQEMFGATETPTIFDGRLPVTLHLLSPAQRPVQVTQDLAGFWDGSYAQVRSEMRGRYPKHPWPENPREAPPTRRVKNPKSGRR